MVAKKSSWRSFFLSGHPSPPDDKTQIIGGILLLAFGAIVLWLILGSSAFAAGLPGGDEAVGKLKAASSLLGIVDTALFKWGARIFAGLCIMSAGWALKEQRFNLPTQCVLQVLFEQAHISALDRTFDKYARAYPGGNPVSRTLFETRLKRIREACNSEDVLAPLVRRLYIALRFFPSGTLKASSRLMKRGESVLYEEMKGFVEASREFRQLTTNFQSNSKVPLRLLDGHELLDVLRRFFNPKTYYKRSFAPYNPSLPISDQLLYNSPTLDFPGIEREGVKTRTLSLKTSPQHAYPGGMAYFLNLPFPFKLALNFKFPTKRQSKSFFDMKEFFLQNTPSARARRQREEILEVQEKLARDDRCLHLTFNVMVEAETDEVLEARVREVVNVFNNDLECETILEDEIGLGLCLNSLPLNYSPRADHATQRYIRILRSDAVKFVPIFDSFRGLKKPVQLFLSRENNLVPFSLLENETSNHTVVLADSGSGKSAFIIDCMQSMKRMAPEPMVFVVDKKSSYVMASEYFDGDLTVFDRGQEMPFTPFRGVYDEEKIAFLTKLLLSGIKLTSPNFNFDSLHQTAISKALKLAYEKKVQQAGLAYVEGELLKQGMEGEVDEYDHMVNDTRLTGVSIPVLLKRAYFKRPRLSPLMSLEDKKMFMRELQRMGNNANQIARALNSGFREGFNDDIAAIQRDLSTLTTFLTHKYGRGEEEKEDID